jgi:hypothetical protein
VKLSLGAIGRQYHQVQRGLLLWFVAAAAGEPYAVPGARLGQRDGGGREGGPRAAGLADPGQWRPPAEVGQPVEKLLQPRDQGVPGGDYARTPHLPIMRQSHENLTTARRAEFIAATFSAVIPDSDERPIASFPSDRKEQWE